MREAAAKGCFVLIDAIVAAGVCLFDSDENAHTPVLCAAEAGQAEMVAHLISKEIEQVAGHKGDPFAKNTSNTTSYQDRVHKEAVAGLSVKIHAYSDDDDDDDDDDDPAEDSGRPRLATI